MVVYIAAPSELREQAAICKRVLELEGTIKVSSRWITMELFGSSDPNYLQTWAENDLADVKDADIVMLINPESFRTSGTGGRHVEVGYALALGKPVLVVGEQTNVFHYHPLVTYLATPGDYVKAVRKLYQRLQKSF